MKISIICAMSKEINMLLPLLHDAKETTVEGCALHTGRIGRHEVCVMQCGIGKVNAALACRAMIDAFGPDLVVNSGVAGGTGAAEVLDVVVGSTVAYHDVWCGPGTTPGQAAGCPEQFEAAEAVMAMRPELEKKGVKFGLIASGDVFVDTPEQVSHILELYPDALGVDMESAALAQACLRAGVSFACIRVISDTPGRVADNGAQYESFWETAPREGFNLIVSIINSL